MPPDSGQRPAANTLSGVPDDCHDLDIVTPSAAPGQRSARESVGVGRVLPLSVLDLAPIVAGGTPGESLRNTLDLARHAERLGYTALLACRAPQHARDRERRDGRRDRARRAGHDATIRVGAGGVMLPNHAPLVIAEQFGTLAALHPGRIDLGLGRAPGTDQRHAARAARRPERGPFPQDVVELQALLGDPQPGQARPRGPGRGLARAALDPRLEPLRRAARGGARAAVRVRLALRARRAGSRARDLPRALPAVRAAATALRDGRRQRDRGGRRRGGPAAVHLRAAGVRERVPRRARPAPASDRRHRDVLVAATSEPGSRTCSAARTSGRPRRCARDSRS